MSLENENKADSHNYKILKSMLKEKSFRYILNNIENISIP